MTTATAPTTFRARLLAAQERALETLLHLAQDLSNPAQARLAATALLRTKVPDPCDDHADDHADESQAPDEPPVPDSAPPNHPRHQPRRAPRANDPAPASPHVSSDTRSTLAAALDRITRSPTTIAAKLLASGQSIGLADAAQLRPG